MIDQSRIDELAEDFGRDDLGELISTFLMECDGVVEVLDGLADDGDLQARSDQFHLLKGCARTIGAVGLGDLCETFEESPGTFSRDDLLHLRSEVQSVRCYFDAQFSDLSTGAPRP